MSRSTSRPDAGRVAIHVETHARTQSLSAERFPFDSTNRSPTRSVTEIGVLALSAALGVFVASCAYTAGRFGYASSPWADRLYWFGQAMIIGPIAIRLLDRKALPPRPTFALIFIVTAAEYILKVAYSPLAFTFADELLHWRSTINILHTGHLFTVNYGLPIGPRYPGLEEVTAALVSVTGLSLFSAGLLVAGIAHMIFIVFLYILLCELANSHRIAGIAMLVYTSSPDLTSFNSMFVYETLALTFMGFAIFASWHAAASSSTGERPRWLILAVMAILATVITHHVTSYMLAITLSLAAVLCLCTRYFRSARSLGGLALISIGAALCWVIFVAPQTLTYFSPTVDGILQGFRALSGGGASQAKPTSAAPLGNQALEAIDILSISALLLLGWWQAWKYFKKNPWVLATALGSVGWFVTIGIRLWTPDGQELAGRTAPFIYIPISLLVALGLAWFTRASLSRLWRRCSTGLAGAGVVVLVFDGLANGWPPYWERLPGSHQVAGFERSVGPEEVATAQWTLEALGRGNRFAADIGIATLLSTYGYQNSIRGIGYLYTSPRLTSSVKRRAAAQALRYVLVDWRLSRSLPVSGSYFPGDANANRYVHPLPLSDLGKFDRSRATARLYDSGDIVIYDLWGWRRGP